jgi:AraC-like DNA-binding protein
MGFSYRIVYVDPSLIQQAIGAGSLPFIADPIVRSRDLTNEFLCEALDMDNIIDDARRIEIAISLAAMLRAVTPNEVASLGPLPLKSLLCVRGLIAADPATQHPIAELERVAGLDRWTLARQFRVAFGTSPTRFRTMRQLDRARLMMKSGLTIADAALEAGFADQSHMSRLFKRAYGLTPGRWLAALV